MVAYAPYLASTSSLSSLYYASSLVPAPSSYATDVCELVTVTVTQYATARPTTNPHGHGGPYFNPYNDIALPYTWPGTPTNGETTCSIPRPTPPYEYGGAAKQAYDAPAWIPKGVNKLVPSLPKGEQNGNSYWGELDCPHLPIGGLPGGPYHSSYPTPSAPYPTSAGHSLYPTASGSASYSGNATKTAHTYSTGTGTGISTPSPGCPKMPDTGVTRTYDLHVAYQTIAPDGVTRNGLTINGQFPGPLVEANWGDWILFKVTNELTDEGTSMHAHGLFQTETPWYDGVPAVQQCPITPNGGTFEQLFRADRYGTSWYHSHYSAQYSGGAHGPMVIYGPKHADYDIDIGPVLIEDWFHADYYTLVNNTMQGRFPPSNNNLINGKMQYPCANTTLPCSPNAGISKFQFEAGKKHLLRLINAGAEGVQKFSIDSHKLTVVALDYIPVEPYETNVVTLNIGQRTDVVVEAVGNPGDAYWMRSQLGTNRCTLNDGISPNAVAAVYYNDADTESVPATESDVTADQLAACKNDDLTLGIPLCKIPIEEPSVTQRLDFEFKSNGTNFLWYINNSSYRGDYNAPILLQAKDSDYDYKPEWNVFDFGSNKTVRLHMVNHGFIGSHPMHLHGHDFHVLAEGFGEWDGTVTNPENSVRRDVQTLQNGIPTTPNPQLGNATVTPSYMVIQFTQDNPGVWPLHCHLAWHVSGGLFLNVLERKDDILKQTFDDDLFELCDKWDAYTAGNPPNQIDSGL
ncbi:multicopper oxidase [Lentithecium fluviatile CBS 122367]|uniref:Multicopper oxidase n=1 Tax=Lentithecium fluviatile CBS 122367 TaxID=1168545 RepID=A0A6G1J741_9PLEO|nr:multicopper oxidase [Lentithecium fluviatile CBS 122367]